MGSCLKIQKYIDHKWDLIFIDNYNYGNFTETISFDKSYKYVIIQAVGADESDTCYAILDTISSGISRTNIINNEQYKGATKSYCNGGFWILSNIKSSDQAVIKVGYAGIILVVGVN